MEDVESMTKIFCDICGKDNQNIISETVLISFNGHYKNTRTIDMCEFCKEKLELVRNEAEVAFMEQSVWWKQNTNDNGDLNYGTEPLYTFRQVGSYEQGGVMCPKCGYSNNSYTFDGTCSKCGYTEQ